MIVCHCHAISDRVVRNCVQEGCASLEAIAAATGAGTCCGGCRDALVEIVDEELGVSAGAPRRAEPALVQLSRRARAA